MLISSTSPKIFFQRTYGLGSRVCLVSGISALLAGTLIFFIDPHNPSSYQYRFWLFGAMFIFYARILKKPYVMVEPQTISIRRGMSSSYTAIPISTIRDILIQEKKIVIQVPGKKDQTLSRLAFRMKDWGEVTRRFQATKDALSSTLASPV